MEDDLSAALVADALDALGLRHQTMTPAPEPITTGMRLVGRALPVRVVTDDVVRDHDPYRSEIDAVDALQPGELPVYAVGDGVEAALWGELFSCAAIGRGAVGAIVDGPVRDVALMAALGFPVFARGRSPLDTRGRARVAAHGEPVVCGGVTVHRGDLVVADDDGVVVCPAAYVDAVRAAVAAKVRDEDGARADLRAGATLAAVWERWQAL